MSKLGSDLLILGHQRLIRQPALQFGNTLCDDRSFRLQAMSRLQPLCFQRRAALVQFYRLAQLGAEFPLLLNRLLIGRVTGLDLIGLGQQALVLGQPFLPPGPFLRKPLQLPLRQGDPCSQFRDLSLDVLELCARRLDPAIGFLSRLDRSAQLCHGHPGRLKCCLILGPPGQFSLDLLQPQCDHVCLILNSPQPFFGPFLVDRPAIEPQYVPQHAFSLGGRLDRELVGPTLPEEGRVDKCVIVKPEKPLDLCLRSPDTAFSDGTPAPVVLHLEVEQGAAALARLASSQHAIGLLPQAKRKLGSHLVLAKMDQFVVPFCPRLTPHCPRDGVKQRRLAGTVFAGQASDTDASKVQGCLAVAHEIGEG